MIRTGGETLKEAEGWSYGQPWPRFNFIFIGSSQLKSTMISRHIHWMHILEYSQGSMSLSRCSRRIRRNEDTGIPLHWEKQFWIFCRCWYGKNSSRSILGNPDLINEEEDDHNDDDNHFGYFWPDHWCSSFTPVSVFSVYLWSAQQSIVIAMDWAWMWCKQGKYLTHPVGVFWAILIWLMRRMMAIMMLIIILVFFFWPDHWCSSLTPVSVLSDYLWGAQQSISISRDDARKASNLRNPTMLPAHDLDSFSL